MSRQSVSKSSDSSEDHTVGNSDCDRNDFSQVSTSSLPARRSQCCHNDEVPGRQAALKGAFLAFQRKPPVPAIADHISSKTLSQQTSIKSTRNNLSPNAQEATCLVSYATSDYRSLTRPPSAELRLEKRTQLKRHVTSDAYVNANSGDSISCRNQELGAGQENQSQRSPHMITCQQFHKPRGRPTMANDPKGASLIAATLAAKRSADPSPRPVVPGNPTAATNTNQLTRGVNMETRSRVSSVVNIEATTDTRPIPPTKTLVNIFERKQHGYQNKSAGNGQRAPSQPETLGLSTNSRAKPNEAISASKAASAVAWGRAATPVKSPHEAGRGNGFQLCAGADSAPGQKLPALASSKSIASEGSKTTMYAKGNGSESMKDAILPPKPQRKGISDHTLSSTHVKKGEGTICNGKKPKPPVKPKPRHMSLATVLDSQGNPEDFVRSGSVPRSLVVSHHSSSSGASFVSASLAPSPHQDEPHREVSCAVSPTASRPDSAISFLPSASATSVPSMGQQSHMGSSFQSNHYHQHQQPRTKESSPLSRLPLESLTSATMAGILASSRMMPSTATEQAPKLSHTRHRALRETLRPGPSQSDDDAVSQRSKKHRKKALNKKKHAHHEGSRRRWRDEITPHERKRYEGVWASNRGLFIGPSYLNLPTDISSQLPDSSRSSAQGELASSGGKHSVEQQMKEVSEKDIYNDDRVVNMVVRDIWSRSRLSYDDLAEVWDLVARRGLASLDRAEFVVGMWIIDQRLRGRKIPVRVGESVWGSAERSNTIREANLDKIKVRKGKGKGLW